jgi:hypothetical protein
MLVIRLLLMRSESPKKNTREEEPISSIDIPDPRQTLSAYKRAEKG